VLNIKPEYWTKKTGEEFVVLTREDFEKVEEMLEDAGLARVLARARRDEADAPTVSLADVKRRLGRAAKPAPRSGRPARRREA